MSSKRLGAALVAAALALATPVVMRWEGLRTEAYLDIVGVPTICYGHTEGVALGGHMTAEECGGLLDAELRVYLALMSACIHRDLEPHQWAAVTSWAYNTGAGAACRSTLVRMINAGHPAESWCPQLRRWVYAGGKPVRGLANRREQELALCLGSI